MTVVLLRHGRSTSNTAHTLAGRTPGVELDDHGRKQAEGVVDRLVGLDIAEIVRSPLLRCEQTVGPIAVDRGLTPVVEDRLIEVDYGDWTGRPLKELLEEPLWKVVQRHASGAVFPGGEGLAQVQARAVAAIREHDARLAEEHGQGTSSGSRARTVTSSNRFSPTRLRCISIRSSASSPSPPRSV